MREVVINLYYLMSWFGLNQLFRLIFSDAEVAKPSSLSKAKFVHYINYGLALYFTEKLIKVINVFPNFSLSFHETLNGKLLGASARLS